jgi:NTP pyrophosphatase (non-canonical NTP hydrolase)
MTYAMGMTLSVITVMLMVVVLVLLYEMSRLRLRLSWAQAAADTACSSELTFGSYQVLAMRTAKPQEPRDRLGHAVLGLADEVGELAKVVKAHLYYGKPLDRINVAEEVGDLLWFAQLAATATNFSLSDIAVANIDKLRQRYPGRYSDSDALARADKAGRAA